LRGASRQMRRARAFDASMPSSSGPGIGARGSGRRTTWARIGGSTAERCLWSARRTAIRYDARGLIGHDQGSLDGRDE
jgi:hypothetical protein